LFLDIDKGMASVVRKVHRVPIDSMQSLEDIVKYLQDNPKHGFKTIVLDSLNELQNLIMRSTIDLYPNIRRPYDDMPGQSDYGKMLDEFDKIVRDLRAINCNVVLIAQTTTKLFETDILQPQLVGKNSARNVCRLMDVIGYLYKTEGGNQEGKKRVMVFDATDYVTKDRSGLLPVTMENPTYQQLYAVWEKRWKPEQKEK